MYTHIKHISTQQENVQAFDKQSRMLLSRIFKSHQVNAEFASHEFNCLLMAYAAYFLKHSPQ